jgi:hypothetical protein
MRGGGREAKMQGGRKSKGAKAQKKREKKFEI